MKSTFWVYIYRVVENGATSFLLLLTELTAKKAEFPDFALKEI